jgi:two-component system chemotaxis response regulator CheB
MINVLVVEDSRVMKEYLVYLIESDPDLRVMGTAGDGETAIKFLTARRPDVILMDILMPGIDGIETTRRIMASNPVPIILCTANTNFDEVGTAMRALEAGAITVLKKPTGFGDPNAEAEAAVIITALKLMSEVKVVRRWNRAQVGTTLNSLVEGEPIAYDTLAHDVAVVAIAASTGGPAALNRILSELPITFPVPILMIQHISVGFGEGFVAWLNGNSPLRVKIAEDGEDLVAGTAYLAGDNRHLGVSCRTRLQCSSEGPIDGFRPSGTYLFESVAKVFGSSTLALILTGMGRDGVTGLRAVKEAGGMVWAQDQNSSVVFGMSGAAIQEGLVDLVLPLEEIAPRLMKINQVKQ